MEYCSAAAAAADLSECARGFLGKVHAECAITKRALRG